MLSSFKKDCIELAKEIIAERSNPSLDCLSRYNIHEGETKPKLASLTTNYFLKSFQTFY